MNVKRGHSMRKSFIKSMSRFLIFPMIISLACSTLSTPSATADPAYRYDNLPDSNNEDAALSKYRAISQWGKTNITYYFINGTDKISGDDEQELIHAAFALWANESSLTFAETSNSSEADILIGWGEGEHGDGDPFDGPGDVLAHASYPNPYTDRQVFLHFDDSERWLDSETRNVDLMTVAAHEIGHTLGLDHSDDPNALMYPSYSEPRRFLGDDDIAGIQSLYGLASAPADAPEAPPQGVTPPPSAGQDSDKDGISDDDEVLRTGTDPNRADSDRDGINDGVEVVYRMNPLDADMDKDGVSDGQEVAQGSDPFFPDQNTNISPELSKDVSEFLTQAIELQIRAYREGDASVASRILAGDLLADLEEDIASLNQQGLVQISEINYYQSYIDDIRIINQGHLEVDSCETWTTSTYRRSDEALIQGGEPRLLPQTITIQQINNNWFITDVQFFNAPAFCDQ
jgi:hypothetical protein